MFRVTKKQNFERQNVGNLMQLVMTFWYVIYILNVPVYLNKQLNTLKTSDGSAVLSVDKKKPRCSKLKENLGSKRFGWILVVKTCWYTWYSDIQRHLLLN
jgi:hypothetical protein